MCPLAWIGGWRDHGWLSVKSHRRIPRSIPSTQVILICFLTIAGLCNSLILSSVDRAQGSSCLLHKVTVTIDVVETGLHAELHIQGWVSPLTANSANPTGHVLRCNDGTPLPNTAQMAQLGTIDVEPILHGLCRSEMSCPLKNISCHTLLQ